MAESRRAGRRSVGRRGPAAAAHSFAVVLVALGLVALASGGCGGAPSPELVVSAASDLTEAMQELSASFTDDTGVKLVFNFGSSGQLAQQIEQGAPVDLFLSANRGYVDELVAAGLVDPTDANPYARGRLVVWTRDDGPTPVSRLSDLADARFKRVAIANPDHAPYGVAAREALQAAGVWTAVEPKVVPAENVLQALQFAESGNADVAIVAASVLMSAGGNSVPVPEGTFTELIQTSAVIKASPLAEEARRFVAFVRGADGQAILATYGFGPRP
ncbi:MAG: molybdate ABC transporter substrate-binding protein [Thermoleophilia bacterium]|nr:molybdate ABC transporter substrate-binding protein [Thermoleophilia bacterium]